MTLDAPLLFPLRREADRLGFVRLDQAAYAAASFLDDRLVDDGSKLEWMPRASAYAQAPRPRLAHFIFHVGHCGSTLLSRLLGAHTALFALREPTLLREAAMGRLTPDEETAVVGFYARVWRPEQTALIKATSFVSEIGPRLMGLTGGRAILLGVTPPVYLRTILSGANSREEAAALAPERRARLERRLGRPLQVRGEGEVIAMSWLGAACALQALAAARPDAALRLDFEAVLRQPKAWLVACLSHLGADPTGLDLDALLAGPVMARYAKGPEAPYDAALRTALLARAASESAGEIRAGMDWLQREAHADPQVAEVLLSAADTARRAPLAPATPAV